jgi:hypothetical protein
VKVAGNERTCLGCGDTFTDYCLRCGFTEDGKRRKTSVPAVPTLSYLRDGEYELIR